MAARIRPGGVGVEFTCDGAVEVETSTCAHCQKITDIPNRRKMHEVVDICRHCMRLICLECYGKPCLPWVKKLDQSMEANYRREQLRKTLGLE